MQIPIPQARGGPEDRSLVTLFFVYTLVFHLEQGYPRFRKVVETFSCSFSILEQFVHDRSYLIHEGFVKLPVKSTVPDTFLWVALRISSGPI